MCSVILATRSCVSSFLLITSLQPKYFDELMDFFCATAALYLLQYQSVPHSFYCHGGGGTPTPPFLRSYCWRA